MRHAILIHAHHLPEQFGRLCKSLSHPGFDVYANIDAKSDVEDFRRAAPQVCFISQRTGIKWGDWSQVEATLNSLREIAASGREYGYVIFISGQDYPTRPLNQIASFLEKHSGREFIGHYCAKEKDKKEWRRLERWYTKRWVHIRPKYLSALINRTLRLLPGKQLPYPMYKGSQWWNLTFDCVNYILDFVEQNPRMIRSYRHTNCSDEFFFQSLLHASPFKEMMDDRYFRYIDWSDSRERPKVLTMDDFDKIIMSGAWFARKTDIRKDGKLLDMLDEHIQKQTPV